MLRLDEDASFSRCVLMDGRELEGDWWIMRPTGCIGQAGVLFAQDRTTGNVVPLTSVILLVAAERAAAVPAATTPAAAAVRAPQWSPAAPPAREALPVDGAPIQSAPPQAAPPAQPSERPAWMPQRLLAGAAG